jgi:hypothetical protein
LAELENLRHRMTAADAGAGDRLPQPQGSESPADSGSRTGSYGPGSPGREGER